MIQKKPLNKEQQEEFELHVKALFQSEPAAAKHWTGSIKWGPAEIPFIEGGEKYLSRVGKDKLATLKRKLKDRTLFDRNN